MKTQPSQENAVEMAAAALLKLEEMHGEFMKHVKSLVKKKVNGGELDSDGNHLLVTCLNIQMKVAHRPIVRDGYPSALEYPFFVKHGDGEILVWQMFLEPNYSLYANLDKQDPICTSANAFLATYIIQPLAAALLRSPIFAPSGPKPRQ